MKPANRQTESQTDRHIDKQTCRVELVGNGPLDL